MPDATACVQSLDELRQFVHRELCRRENLLPEQFELQEVLLQKKGLPCGLQFTLFGPRLVKLGAVWAADQNWLYLYDATGERFGKLRFSQYLPLPSRAAA